MNIENDPLWYYYMGYCYQHHPQAPNPDYAEAFYTRFLEEANKKTIEEEIWIGGVKNRTVLIEEAYSCVNSGGSPKLKDRISGLEIIGNIWKVINGTWEEMHD